MGPVVKEKTGFEPLRKRNGGPGGDETEVPGEKIGLTPRGWVGKHADEVEGDVETWQELARLFDAFFFYVFAVILFVVTLVIFTLLYAQY